MLFNINVPRRGRGVPPPGLPRPGAVSAPAVPEDPGRGHWGAGAGLYCLRQRAGRQQGG